MRGLQDDTLPEVLLTEKDSFDIMDRTASEHQSQAERRELMILKSFMECFGLRAGDMRGNGRDD